MLSRGSVTLGLRLARGAVAALPRVNPEALEAAIAAALAVSEAAAARGLDLAPMTAADLIAVRGVLEAETATAEDYAPLVAQMATEVDPLFADLAAARASEGAALASLLVAQLDRIETLGREARITAEARAGRAGALLKSRLEAVLAATAVPAVDEGRLAQELALIAVKGDVTEELDRLEAHVAAARAMIAGNGAVGRKLDFLMQEFNREANTLCSKAAASDLTAIGLEMKVVIDQMREQVQNVE